MASGITRLARDTAVYGLSSIVGKFLNWMLVPMYVRVLPDPGAYGIVTNLYSWVALLLVLLTYGMETGFFRFINKKEETNPLRVYTSILTCLFTTSSFFCLLVFLFLNPISAFTGYNNYPEFIGMLGVIVAMDAFSSLPFAYLRYQGKAGRFAFLKLLNIFLNILLNVFFLVICPWIYSHSPELINWFYIPDYGVGYIFIANTITASVNILMLTPEIKIAFKGSFDTKLLRQILLYSLPILILGIAGIFNQTADKILFPLLFEDKDYANTQLGIYGACFKIAVVMVMFIQAFRYAYEPFIFASYKSNNDSKKGYSQVMKYFIIFSLLIFLGVMFYLDILKHFVSPDYYPGLRVVPIVMLGEFFFGIYFNLSFWYKLIDQTRWGAYFSFAGCIITVSIILLFAPTYGYMACAWASFFSNLFMMLLSYIIGQKKFPIEYDLRSALIYTLLTAAFFAAGMLPEISSTPLRMLYRTGLLTIFIFFVIKRDLPLKDIPYINRFIK